MESVVPVLVPGANNLPPLVPSTESDSESEGDDAELRSPVATTNPQTIPDPAVADPVTIEDAAPEPEAKPVVGWHRDSYPCVIYLYRFVGKANPPAAGCV